MHRDASYPPTIFVILGITGDLAQKKLIPALLDLYVRGKLPLRFRIVGFSRREFSHEDFRSFLNQAITEKAHHHNQRMVQEFLNTIFYHQGLFDDEAHYVHLAEMLQHIDKEFGQCSNKLFYLAVPPAHYEVIFKNLAHSKLTVPCSEEAGWTRILVEKPFGNDVDTAVKLDRMLGKLFREEQIFRIDHYLAKETVQNILSFRFSNTIFEPLWNHRYIGEVHIQFLEKHDLSKRGAFYDPIGALRDVGQNHLLQMLSLIAMENPRTLTASDIRSERARVLERLSLSKKFRKYHRRAQYEGYRDEANVLSGSETETYFRLALGVRNSRWRGVPFFLESGKALNESSVSITIHFKALPKLHFFSQEERECRNTLTFMIQPKPGIKVSFWAKKPGFDNLLQEKPLSFFYAESDNDERIPDAYERVLFDCIRGDQTLFASTEEVIASWKFITPILKRWKKTPLYRYARGADPQTIGEEINEKSRDLF